MTKDYYKILDITEFSTIDEIKCAYRTLARKYHPDIAGNSPSIIAKFKEINEAYEVLSNKTRKADYDAARRFYSYAQNGASKKTNTSNTCTDNNINSKSDFAKKNYNKKTFHDKKTNFSFNWEELFKFSHTNESRTPKKGEDIYSDIEISVFEAINGTSKVINMLQTTICPKCNGRKFVNGGKCENCNGKGETSTYKRFNVKIPAGIKDKSKIRLAEEGEKGINGGKNGDLYLTIHIKEPKGYKTEGLNILKTIPVTPYEAVLGAEIKIPTIKGNIALKIAPNTRSGQKIRLNGCGIEQNNKIGDMIVTIEIQIPKDLSEAEINLYKKLQEISNHNVREI